MANRKYRINPMTGKLDRVATPEELDGHYMTGSVFDVDDDAIIDKAESLDDGEGITVTPSQISKSTTAVINYYVNPDTGSDSNDGTSGSPFATIQYAINLVPKILKHKVYLHLQDSLNYAENIIFKGFSSADVESESDGDGTIDIISATGNADNVLLTFDIMGEGGLRVRNCSATVTMYKISMRTTSAVSPGSCVHVKDSNYVRVHTCKLADNDQTDSVGIINAGGSHVVAISCSDYDAKKVAIGLSGDIRNDGSSFGDIFEDTTIEYFNTIKPHKTHRIYVDGERDDTYTPTGSMLRPFKNIEDAIDSITDATFNNQYSIMIAPKNNGYTLTSTLNLKSYVGLIGDGQRLTRIKVNNGTAVDTVTGSGITHVVMESIWIQNNNNSGGYKAVKFTDCAHMYLDRVSIYAKTGVGLYLADSSTGLFTNVYLTNYVSVGSRDYNAIYVGEENSCRIYGGGHGGITSSNETAIHVTGTGEITLHRVQDLRTDEVGKYALYAESGAIVNWGLVDVDMDKVQLDTGVTLTAIFGDFRLRGDLYVQSGGKISDTINEATIADIKDAVNHKDLTNNPHSVEVGDLGLATGNTASDIDDAIAHKDLTNNPHAVTASQTDAYTKAESDELIHGSFFDYFLSDTLTGETLTGSDIDTYYLAYPNETGAVESTIVKAGVASDATLIAGFITEVAEPQFGTLNQGIYNIHLHPKVNTIAGVLRATLYAEFYQRETDGTETLLFTSEESSELIASMTSLRLHGILPADVYLSAGDRILIKVLANVDGSGGNPTITLYLEGTHDCHFSILSTITAFDAKYMQRKAGDINSFAEKATIVDNDLFILEDSEASNVKKKMKQSTIITDVKADTDVADALAHKDLTNNPHSVDLDDMGLATGTVAGDIDDAITKKHTRAHDIDGASDHNGLSGTGIEDNFMAIDANGLPKDSTKNATDFAPSDAKYIVPEANGDLSAEILTSTLSLSNLVYNGSFQYFYDGTTSQPDAFEDEGSPDVLRDTGEADNLFATPYSVKYTCGGTGATDEGGKQTLANLKPSTTYAVSVRAKTDGVDTARLLTTGGSVNIDTETTSASWVTLTGTFTTDGTPADVVIKLVAKNNGDIAWFDNLMVVEGVAPFKFSEHTRDVLYEQNIIGVGYINVLSGCSDDDYNGNWDFAGKYAHTINVNKTMYFFIPLPSNIHGAQVVIDSIVVHFNTQANEDYITSVGLQQGNLAGSITSLIGHTDDIANGSSGDDTHEIVDAPVECLDRPTHVYVAVNGTDTNTDVRIYGLVVKMHGKAHG